MYESEGTKRHLIHDGYRFYQNGLGSKRTGSTSWLCVSYYRNRCRARATTCTINGYDMVRLNQPHTHPPNEAPKRYFTNENINHIMFFSATQINNITFPLYRTIQKSHGINKFFDEDGFMKMDRF